ncbi:MAG: aminotransferase class IV [Bacteroidales bacterium]
MNDYLFYNSRYIKKERFELPYNNRAFLYGDGFFETLHANGTEPQFLQDHLTRIRYALDFLKLHLPDSYGLSKLNNAITGLLVRNKLFVGARVRLTFFRLGEGKYTPAENTCALLIDTEPLPSAKYQLNDKGLDVDLFEQVAKPNWPLGRFKSTNASLYTLAGIYARQHALDDVFLVNSQGDIVEATSSNIFVYKDDKVFTPSLESGCVAGIMRKQLFKVLASMGLPVDTTQPLSPEFIKGAEEIWLSNSVTGIRWIKKFRSGRFYNLKARTLTRELNYMAFEYL